jgi:hypothetical protein
MIESSSWLSSILGLSTVSFSSIEMEATEIKKGCYNDRIVLLATPFTVSSLEMEVTEINLTVTMIESSS